MELVVPVSLYVLNEQLHHVLRGYKDHRVEATRRQFQARVAALLARFLHRHGGRIQVAAGLRWDYITTVPSSGTRVGPHPLETAIGLVPWLRKQYRRVLERGQGELDHRQATDHGYRPTEDVNGHAVLVIDDTFTSGARAQSAASALQLAGAGVVAMVVLGRVIDPTFSDESKALLERARGEEFSFDLCCLD
jgi:predicted amidophosphoribosyltransferase